MKTMKTLLAFLILTAVGFAETKQDILDDLAIRYRQVGIPQLVQDTSQGVNDKYYQVRILDVNSDSLARGRTAKFHVEYEDLPNEAAYHDKSIALPVEDLFTPVIIAYLDTVSSDYIYHYRRIVWTRLETLEVEVEVNKDSTDWDKVIPTILWMQKTGPVIVHKELQQ